MPSPGEDVQSWSTIAGNNGTADALINWQEGQPRASVNNSARGMMAALAKHRNLNNGSIVTTGAANAQRFASGVSYTEMPAAGFQAKLKIGITNTGPATLEMDLLGPIAVKTVDGVDIGINALMLGQYADFIYNGANWVLLSQPNTAGVPQCGRLRYVNATTLSFLPYAGDVIKIGGVMYPIPPTGVVGLANTSVYVNGVAAQNLVAGGSYVVCAFNNGGVITADFRTGGHSMSVTPGNVGTEILTGDDSRTVLGRVQCKGSGPQFADSPNERLVLTWFNRRSRGLAGTNTNDASTVSGTPVELTSASRVVFLVWGDEDVVINVNGRWFNNFNVASVWIGSYFDGTEPGHGLTYLTPFGVNVFMLLSHAYSLSNLSEGYHWVSPWGSAPGGALVASIAVEGLIRG